VFPLLKLPLRLQIKTYRGFTHPMRTSYELPDNRYCKKCGRGRQHRCHEKIKTTYEPKICPISTETGLLWVNCWIRRGIVPLFYEDYPILLTLREGLVTCLPKKALKMYALTEPNCDRRNVCYTKTLGKEILPTSSGNVRRIPLTGDSCPRP